MTVEGDWKKLYNMVASESRGIDYLSRGAQEIVREYGSYPDLDIEKNLVLIYDKDHVLYVSPRDPELFSLLKNALESDGASQIIKATVEEFYSDVYAPPISLGDRRIIKLELPGN